VTLRTRFLLYVAAVQLPLAVFAFYLYRHDRVLLLAVEAMFIVSLSTGIVLVRKLLAPLEALRSGAAFLSERDFSTRLKPTGQLELDALIDVYNRMIDSLREERIRLEEQQWFLAKVLQASPSGVVTLDFERRVASLNPRAQEMLGVTAEEAAGKRLAALGTPFAAALDGIGPGESRVVPLHGSRRVKAQGAEFLDRGFTRPFLVLEELTEELRQSEKAAYEKLIRMMSHEVNNSLGAASSLLHSCLLYKDQLSPDDRGDFENALNVVLARTERLNGFMKEFADVVRLPEPRKAPSDVLPLLRGIATLLGPEAERRRIALAWDVGDTLEAIPLDRRQLEQVFVNVLKNAMEAIGEDGAITIRTGRRGGRRFVEVEDSGPGIPEEVRAQLFRPFFTTKENGQGLGLTVTQEILARHGFDFSLESAPGGPTRFTIVVG